MSPYVVARGVHLTRTSCTTFGLIWSSAPEESKAFSQTDHVMTEKLQIVQHPTHYCLLLFTYAIFTLATCCSRCALSSETASPGCVHLHRDNRQILPQIRLASIHICPSQRKLYCLWLDTRTHAQYTLTNPVEKRDCLDVCSTLLEYCLHSPRTLL